MPGEGRHAVKLVVTTPRANLVEAQRVDVQDWLIVSLGDSVASGEGVPEAQGRWQSARCHRSALSGTALAAKQIERDDVHSSVTFVHLACSGAEVPQGLLGPYAGAIPPDEEPPLTPQVDELDRIAQHRGVDAVLLSVGANDIHFSEFLSFCLKKNPLRNCFKQTYTKVGGDGEKSAEAVANGFVDDLPHRYAALAQAISGPVPPSRVHIVEYFDPTNDTQGRPCGRLIGSILRPNVERAERLLFTPLNRAVAAAARQHGWDEVSGVADLFRTHGICAKQAWVSSLPDSLIKLRGLAGRHRGAMHPNDVGHKATSELIVRSLERDLYGSTAAVPRTRGQHGSRRGCTEPE